MLEQAGVCFANDDEPLFRFEGQHVALGVALSCSVIAVVLVMASSASFMVGADSRRIGVSFAGEHADAQRGEQRGSSASRLRAVGAGISRRAAVPWAGTS